MRKPPLSGNGKFIESCVVTGEASCDSATSTLFDLKAGHLRAVALGLGRYCAREMYALGLTGNEREPSGTAVCGALCLEAQHIAPPVEQG